MLFYCALMGEDINYTVRRPSSPLLRNFNRTPWIGFQVGIRTRETANKAYHLNGWALNREHLLVYFFHLSEATTNLNNSLNRT